MILKPCGVKGLFQVISMDEKKDFLTTSLDNISANDF